MITGFRIAPITSRHLVFALLMASTTAAGEVKTKIVAVGLSSVTGFANPAHLRSSLGKELQLRFKDDPDVRLIGTETESSQPELLKRSWEQGADDATLIEVNKPFDSTVSVRLSIFGRRPDHASVERLDGRIWPPGSGQDSSSPTTFPPRETKYGVDAWGEPFVAEATFEPLKSGGAYYDSVAKTVATWSSPLVRFLRSGLVPLDLIVGTKPGEAQMFWQGPSGSRSMEASPAKGPRRYQFFDYPGAYVLKATKEDYADATQAVVVLPDSNPPLTFILQLKKARPKKRFNDPPKSTSGP